MSKHKYYSLRSYLSYMAHYKWRVLLVFVSFLISNLLIAVIPVFVGRLVGVLAAKPLDSDMAWMYVGLLIVCSTAHDLTWRLSEILYRHLLNPIGFRYENIAFEQVIRKPYPYFVDKFTGKVASYVNTLGKEYREFMENVYWQWASHTVSLVTVAVILTALNWQTGFSFIAGLVLMLVVGRYTVRNSTRYEKAWMDVQSTKNGKIIDAIANFVNVKSFKKESVEIDAINHEQEITIKAANKAFLWGIVFWGSMSFIVRNLIWPAAIVLNVYLFTRGEISLADLTTLLTAILLFTSFIWEIIWVTSQFALRLARMEEAYRYLFGDKDIVKAYFAPSPPQTELPGFKNQLGLHKLTFTYPEGSDSVLKDIDLSISKGEKIGIVGKSGSGKTTITKLLLGYYPVQAGQVTLDEQAVDTSQLARLISYVPQDTSLFHRTISQNIAYAADRRVGQIEIVRAARQAHAEEFISQIPQGYQALVGERGVKLSAGQRQRIAIARAFLDDKPILILDEATSALDSESERLVQSALEKLWQHKTVIAIAHRLSTLRNMDRIIVLDKGRITESGSHDELLAAGGRYARLWAHQSGGFINED